ELSLAKHLDDLDLETKEKPEVQRAIKAVRDFSRLSLVPLYRQISDMTETNPVAALAQYRDSYPQVREQRERLLAELSQQVGLVQQSGIQVNTAATEIAATAREQQSTANEIAATTAEIGATSKEISATSKELVKTMNEVSGVAEETANVAGSGQTAIGKMEA